MNIVKFNRPDELEKLGDASLADLKKNCADLSDFFYNCEDALRRQWKNYIVELPVSEKIQKDLQILIRQKELVINSEEKSFYSGKKKSNISFFRSLRLPADAVIEKIKVYYCEDKLIIKIPRANSLSIIEHTAILIKDFIKITIRKIR